MKENETKQWIELSGRVLVNSYARNPVAFVRGKGTRLWGADGKEYLDFLAGISVVGLGHCHPKVVAAIKKQSEIVRKAVALVEKRIQTISENDLERAMTSGASPGSSPGLPGPSPGR